MCGRGKLEFGEEENGSLQFQTSTGVVYKYCSKWCCPECDAEIWVGTKVSMEKKMKRDALARKEAEIRRRVGGR
jgi:hypothetical protein